jgi:hypothetical protein
MEQITPIIYEGKEYLQILTVSRLLHMTPPQVHYYLNSEKLKKIKIEKTTFIELSSVLQLNDYLAFRAKKDEYQNE